VEETNDMVLRQVSFCNKSNLEPVQHHQNSV
jgi:hypothetical protein